jgi:hypothetical protein
MTKIIGVNDTANIMTYSNYNEGMLCYIYNNILSQLDLLYHINTFGMNHFGQSF